MPQGIHFTNITLGKNSIYFGLFEAIEELQKVYTNNLPNYPPYVWSKLKTPFLITPKVYNMLPVTQIHNFGSRRFSDSKVDFNKASKSHDFGVSRRWYIMIIKIEDSIG
jgi:hypothetical protein